MNGKAKILEDFEHYEFYSNFTIGQETSELGLLGLIGQIDRETQKMDCFIYGDGEKIFELWDNLIERNEITYNNANVVFYG